jgi:outer membrane protein assembly factor BamB
MKFQPYGRAPDTAHVIWTKPISFGGLVGGGNSITPGMTFYSGTAYELKFSYPIIMYGNVYYSLPEANDATGNGVTGVNLRTGETLWTNPNVNSFAFGQFYDYESPNQHGTIPNGYLWAMSGFGSSAKWMAVDPFNGKLLFNLTAVPSGGQYVVGPQGEMLKYILGRRNNTSPYTFVNVWNNTAGAGETAGSDPVSRAEWRPNGKEINMSQAYSANITLSQGLPSGAAIIQVWHGDMIFGTSSLTQAIGQTETGWGTPDPWTMWAINLNPSRGQVGNVMWIRNYTAPDGNKTVLFGPRDGETHIWTIYYRETMQWTGFDLLTGDQKWGPTASENNWNYYGGTTSLTTPYAMGYSTLYAAGFSGILYAYDMATGQLKFTYGNNASDPYNSTSSGLETVYGVYPMQVAAVGNDKVYLVPSEHSLNAPPYAGARVRAVNAHNGKELWKMHGMVNWQSIALADGYFVYINYNDMQIYALGPGPSATTVSASPKVVPQGGSVMIEGTVTDQSPQTSLKGTAAISDKDQGPWMEATIMKNAVVPMDATGVPVTIVAIDSQGTVFDVGTVTSDTGGLFHKLWTPPAEGEYTIIARFDGSGSYGGSAAETSVGVTAAPSASPPASPTVSPTTAPPTVTPISTPSPSTPVNPTGGSETALYVGIAAAVIIIAIAASAVILRRRK